MKKILQIMLCSLALSTAHGSTSLSSAVTADNEFKEYLSSSLSLSGATLLNSGNSWGSDYIANTSLSISSPAYLIIEAKNQGGPGAILGSFSLSDANFQFGNGGQSIKTGDSGWTMYVGSLTSTPVSIVPEGLNGIAPWGNHPAIDANASWVWYYESAHPVWGSDLSTVYLVTTLTPANVPLPAAVWLMGTVLMGFLGLQRRKT